MNPIIDFVLVALLVLFSALIAAYTLSPLKAKRWMLSKISRFISFRLINRLLPNNCGCDGCAATIAGKTQNLPKNS